MGALRGQGCTKRARSESEIYVSTSIYRSKNREAQLRAMRSTNTFLVEHHAITLPPRRAVLVFHEHVRYVRTRWSVEAIRPLYQLF